ncbi:hypothetical protein [Flavisolibacter nicotianae]|uniref:hypothetical protein n=1 Tax=Flavisolibacter nicotianae TaxID=2364882 RepID=UPI0013C47C50|nr:hypothetical protein [Flavisolibacter nicotianae]
MKRGHFLLGLLAALALSCNQIAEPEFRELENFQVKKLGFDQVSIGLGMTFYNPNNFSVTVKETGADVYVDSVFLGKFSQDTAVAVSQKADFTIPLSGSIPLTTFLKMDLKDIGNREVLIRADGSTKLGKAGIFISKDIQYSGRHRLSDVKLK